MKPLTRKFFEVKRIIISVLIVLSIVTLSVVVPIVIENDSEEKSFRALLRPIGDEPLLITSAGQSTDIYVMKDIANKLMIDNYFIPMATEDQIDEIKSVVIVVGYSEIGIRLNDIDLEKEKRRVKSLLEAVDTRSLSIITIYLRGSQMLNEANQQLLKITTEYSDYLIVAEDSNNAGYFIELAENKGIPVTIVNNVNEISEPFVSVFR